MKQKKQDEYEMTKALERQSLFTTQLSEEDRENDEPNKKHKNGGTKSKLSKFEDSTNTLSKDRRKSMMPMMRGQATNTLQRAAAKVHSPDTKIQELKKLKRRMTL